MKFRRIVFLFIIAIIPIAFFTNPARDKFMAYIQPQINRYHTGPVVEYSNHVIYSVAKVNFFNISPEQGRLLATGNKETYIGLFGRFWKIDK